jgi:ABC-type multidrug transport system fused ATPase/permease subunit
VTPAKWLSVDHLRYEYADVVDVSRHQLSGTSPYTYCSHDEGLYTTMGDSIAFTDGFRSVKETGGIKCHAEAIEYDVNKDHPEKSNSKYTVVVRANRAAFTQGNFLPSTFLTTYINLFAIIIWITIAFYNQSYAGEDALGMLGTGMFSAISATIVGFQMVSDASMFSLLTMINIFTLAVILIMTYQSVMAKRANAKKDKALIAYNGVKLRVMFYVLTFCTLVIFIGLPIAAYIWTL